MTSRRLSALPAPLSTNQTALNGGLEDAARRSCLRGLVGAGLGLSAASALTGCGGGSVAGAQRRPTQAEPGSLSRAPNGEFSVRIGTVRLHGVDLGAPAAPGDATVVLIHGAGANHRDWTFDLAGRLASRHRVVAFDRPGFGRSQRPETDPGEPASQARYLAAAADALGLERRVLVGHSWGGAVAMAWTLQRPEEVGGVVAVAGATMPWNADQTLEYFGVGFSTIGAMLFEKGAAGKIALQKVFEPQKLPRGYARHLGYAGGLDAAPLWETVGDIWTLNAALERMRPRYGAIRAPITIMHGDQDEITPIHVHALPLASAAPHAELMVFKGVGHMVHHARPGQVAGAIDQALRTDRRNRRA
ncbi:MAG: alpha/beta hydrolase [Rhodobacteraceae bacterium]|nr:alpha/beta hydrolase [Paracoccaceae bacterium]